MNQFKIRIGNILNHKPSGLNVPITGINSVGFTTFRVGINTNGHDLITAYDGVKLNHSLLVKIGFQCIYKGIYTRIVDENTLFELNSHEDMGLKKKGFYWKFKIGEYEKYVHIKWLHELQNLFSTLFDQEIRRPPGL